MIYLTEFIVISIFILLILMRKSKQKEEFLSILMSNEMKGVAIILIFAVHGFSEPSLILKYGGYGVGVFLFLSGFGLYQSDKLEKTNSKDFIKKRLFRIFPPLLIFLILFTIIWILFPSIATMALAGYAASNFLSFIYINFARTPLWYVLHIIFWYIIYYIILNLNLTRNNKLILLFFFGVLIILIRPFESISYLQPIREWFVYALCFPLGVLASFKIEQIKKFLSLKILENPASKIIVCVIIFMSIYVLREATQNLPYPSIHFIVTSPLFIVGVLTFFYFFLREYRSKFLGFLGKLSYEIYLVHSFMIVIFIRLGTEVFMNNGVLSFFAAFIASVIVSLPLKHASKVFTEKICF